MICEIIKKYQSLNYLILGGDISILSEEKHVMPNIDKYFNAVVKWLKPRLKTGHNTYTPPKNIFDGLDAFFETATITINITLMDVDTLSQQSQTKPQKTPTLTNNGKLDNIDGFKLEIDKDKDPGYKLQTANENIEDTECNMINMFTKVCNQLTENLNQWDEKINAQNTETLFSNCQKKENDYLKYKWPAIESGIINEITNKTINEEDIEDNIKEYLNTKYNELLNDEIGRRFLETKMTNNDIVVILGDRDKQYSSDDLYKLFRYRHTKKLLQDKTNADFLNQRYQDENYEKEINSIMKKISLGNEFFNIKLSQRALAELYFVTRNNILRWPEDVEDNERIEVSKMNMFFYLLQAFVDCREELKQKAKDSANPVQSNSYIGSQLVPNGELSDSVFCALIHQWFPNIKFDKEEYDARAFAQAISTERSKWNKNSLSNTFEDKKIILNKAKDHLLKLNLKFIRNNEKYFK